MKDSTGEWVGWEEGLTAILCQAAFVKKIVVPKNYEVIFFFLNKGNCFSLDFVSILGITSTYSLNF